MNTATDHATRTRCAWPGDDPLYVAYHDDEWGRALTDDQKIFEKVSLEGFQAGLSWITILRKRDAFRAAFSGFHLEAVAAFGEADMKRLMGDTGIVRNRAKISAAISNAQAALDLVESVGSLREYFWSFAEPETYLGNDEVRASSPHSIALSRDLKRRGWRFVGPTTMYAFMQSAGMVNDHAADCEWREVCAAQDRPTSSLVNGASVG